MSKYYDTSNQQINQKDYQSQQVVQPVKQQKKKQQEQNFQDIRTIKALYNTNSPFVSQEQTENSTQDPYQMDMKNLQQYLKQLQSKNQMLKAKMKDLPENSKMISKIKGREEMIKKQQQMKVQIKKKLNVLKQQLQEMLQQQQQILNVFQNPQTFIRIKEKTFFEASLLYFGAVKDRQTVHPRQNINVVYQDLQTENVLKAVEELKNQYGFDMVRKVKGDGNCYYRSVCYAYIEYLIKPQTPISELQQFIQKLSKAEGI